MRFRLGGCFAIIAALALACGPLRRGDTPQAVVIFDNQSFAQADVYAVRAGGGGSFRIGTVFPGRRETLRLPSSALGGGTVTIVARLLASSRVPSSGPLSLAPGDSLEITLPPDARVLTVLPARQP